MPMQPWVSSRARPQKNTRRLAFEAVELSVLNFLTYIESTSTRGEYLWGSDPSIRWVNNAPTFSVLLPA